MEKGAFAEDVCIMEENDIQDSVNFIATNLFDSIKQIKNGIEYWSARDLSEALGYARWENFEAVIIKAKLSISNSGGSVENHFRDVTKMVEVGSRAVRPVKDFLLSRYACYIVSQNGNPSKNEIALAQSYFAHQTYKQELVDQNRKDMERLEARNKFSISDKQLSSTVMRRGVNQKELAMMKSQGDRRLFGGKSTQDMKNKYKIVGKKPLADHLPVISLTAKQLANEMTTINSENKDLQGVGKIGYEHLKNNDEVRRSLVSRGIKIEDLPPEEDIKKVEKRLKNNSRKEID